MFLRLLVLISFWCNAIGTLDLIREGLVEMTNDLPHRAIEDIVSKHQEMIEIIHTYKTLTLSFQEEYFFRDINSISASSCISTTLSPRPFLPLSKVYK